MGQLEHPMFENAVWSGQWFAIPVLPIWLLVATEWLAGDGWTSLFLLIFFCPILLIALTITALLSLMVRNTHNRATVVYAVGSVITWALVVIYPLFTEQQVDSVIAPPSFAERAGVSIALDQAAEVGIFWACCGLFVITWASVVVARLQASRLPKPTAVSEAVLGHDDVPGH
jgi:hypothetical protein